jgi:hypothetical protein
MRCAPVSATRYGIVAFIARSLSGLSLTSATVASPDGGGAAVRIFGYVSDLINWMAMTSCP